MKNLVFKTEKNYRRTSFGRPKTETVFVQEGTVNDVISDYDGSRHFGSIFFHQEGDEGFDSSIDENWYYTDCNHLPLLCKSDLDDDGNGMFGGDCGENYIWSVKASELSDEEIKAVLNANSWHDVDGIMAETGWCMLNYELAKHFNDLDTYAERESGYMDWMDIKEVGEDDDWDVEVNDKFYKKF
jgi:hypothetical protein